MQHLGRMKITEVLEEVLNFYKSKQQVINILAIIYKKKTVKNYGKTIKC